MCCNEKDKGKLVSNGELVHRATACFPFKCGECRRSEVSTDKLLERKVVARVEEIDVDKDLDEIRR